MRNERSKSFALAPFAIPAGVEGSLTLGIWWCVTCWDFGLSWCWCWWWAEQGSCPGQLWLLSLICLIVWCLQVSGTVSSAELEGDRLGSVPSGPSHNLPQVHLTSDHEDIDLERCRQLHVQLQKRHTLASSKSASSDPSNCEIHPKSRAKNTCPVLLGHLTLPQPDMISYEAVSCAHVMNQWFEGWAQSWA